MTCAAASSSSLLLISGGISGAIKRLLVQRLQRSPSFKPKPTVLITGIRNPSESARVPNARANTICGSLPPHSQAVAGVAQVIGSFSLRELNLELAPTRHYPASDNGGAIQRHDSVRFAIRVRRIWLRSDHTDLRNIKYHKKHFASFQTCMLGLNLASAHRVFKPSPL